MAPFLFLVVEPFLFLVVASFLFLVVAKEKTKDSKIKNKTKIKKTKKSIQNFFFKKIHKRFKRTSKVQQVIQKIKKYK